MSNETADECTSANAHAIAAKAFVDHARSQHGDDIAKLYVFGSTVRGETRGLASDVDVLVVLDKASKQDAVTESLRDLAYDVMLDYGPVVELHILSETAFLRHQQEGNPFIRNVVSTGRSYA